MEKSLQVIMPDVIWRDINVTGDILQTSYRNRDVSLVFPYSTPDASIPKVQENGTFYVPDGPPGKNETEYKVAEVLWQVCPVILFLFGTVGNIMILLMLRTLRLGRTSMHMYLRALAISDLCVLYTGLLRWWIFWSFGVDLRNQNVFLCKFHPWMVYVVLYISAWLLVFMTLERTCSACIPHRVNTFCTKRRACCLIIFIIVFQALMQSHFLFGMTLKDSDDGLGDRKCQEISDDYTYFIHDIYPFVDLVLLSLIPFICVILGNIIIIWKTFLSLKTAAGLNLSSKKGATLRRRRASSMTVILVCLSTLFLLTTSPTCVYNMWERGETAKAAMRTSLGNAQTELAWASVNIIMYCNNTFNFYLYCLSGRKFRTEIRRQFSRKRADSHSAVMSAASVHRHRCPQSEPRYLNGRENVNENPKSTENGNGSLKVGEDINKCPTSEDKGNRFYRCKQISDGFQSDAKNGKCYLLYSSPYLTRNNSAYL